MADNEQQSAITQIRQQGGVYLFDTRLEALEREQAEQRKRDEEYRQRDDSYKKTQIEIATEETRIFAKQVNLERKQTGLTLILAVIGFLAILVAGWQTWEGRRSANAAIDAAKEATLSRQQAQAALNASIAASRLDQRAWVELEPIKPVLLFAADNTFGKLFQYDIYIKNVGKTVAREVTLTAHSAASASSLGDDADQMRRTQNMLRRGEPGDTGINNRVPRVLAPGAVSAVPSDSLDKSLNAVRRERCTRT